MKQLTKVRIINWHYFWDETIPMGKLVFLTGLNGSGKSTLIDALQVVLLGDTAGKFFNKAAMDKSARTLKGYLRGELGDSTDGTTKYLRPGRFTSYIALEWWDDLHNVPFTLGIVFDVYETGDEEHSFFFLNDKIPENGFVVDKTFDNGTTGRVPMSKKELSDYLEANYKGKYNFFQSNASYREFLKKQLGGLKDKYFALLKKATSFSPITDVTKFITEFICDPQENISLEKLQTNILAYRKLEDEAKKLQLRIDALNKIHETYRVYVDQLRTYNIGNYILEKCTIDECKERIDQFNERLVAIDKRLKEIDTDISSHRASISKLDAQKAKLQADKAQDTASSLINDLNAQKISIESDIAKIESQEELVQTNLRELCDSYLNAISELETNISSFDFSSISETSKDDINDLQDACVTFSDQCLTFKTNYVEHLEKLDKDAYDEFRQNLVDFKQVVSGLSVSLSRNIRDLNARISSLKGEQENISSGKKVYPRQYESAREYVKNQLTNQYKKDIDVNFLCELIDIKDPSWTDAIEGYLNINRFYLFVDAKYFEDAFAYLKQYTKTYGYVNIAIVDTERIIKFNPQAEINSLADEIKTSHDGARAYVNYLIGKLYKCKDEREARESGRGITKSCSLYQNFTLTTINPRLYETSYIGNVSERMVKEKQKQLQANIENLSAYNRLNNLISKVNTLEGISSNEVEGNLRLIQDISLLDGLRTNLNNIQKQLDSQDSELVKSIDKRIANIDSDIKTHNDRIDELNIEKGNLQSESKTISEDKITAESNKINEIQNRLSNQYDESLIEEANQIFDELRNQGETNKKIYNDFNKDISRLSYVLSQTRSQLIRDRRAYCQEYHLSYDVESEDNTLFDADLTDYQDNKLPEYKQKIEDSYNKAIEQFKSDFISKLRSAIEDVQDQMNSLNEALQDATFGKDSYRFTVQPNPVYRRYYDMLMDPILLEDDEAFNEKYKDVMDDLFKQIIDVGDSNKNSELLLNVEKYTDYRNYLDFDIIVYERDTGNETKLSTKMKTNSGGETQTPFYIAVLASFSQLYHVKDKGEAGNTARIIIFDEAFSKMDRSRIQESIKLLRDFDLQVIVSAPSDKVGDITGLVDETLVVLRDHHKSEVRLFAEDKLG